MAESESVHPDADLETISALGKPPKSRISNSRSAWNIVHRLIERDESRSRKRAIVQGQIDGNRPYDATQLLRQGQSHRSNVNFRDAEAMRDSRKTSYYELIMEVENLVEVEVKDYVDPQQPDVDWGEIIAEKFTDMLVEWSGWWYNMLLHQEQFVTWGAGNIYWENEIDWRFTAARVGSFLVPDETKATLDKFDVVGIRDSMLVHELFKYVKDEETTLKSRENGWNTKLAIKLIRNAAGMKGGFDNHMLGEWESLQQKIKDNDLEYSYGDYEAVPVTHLLVKEFDGKISHFIVHELEETNDQEKNGGEPYNFLYVKEDQYETWQQAVCLFLANVGEGTYHSVRGLGAKIFAHCQIGDRLKNTLLDGAMASATILLQPANEGQREKLRMVRYGPFSVMPNGFNLVPHGSFQPNLTALISVDALIGANLNKNVGMYRPDVTEEEKTPQAQNTMEIRNRASKEAKLEKSDIHLYYVQWDNLYEEIKRRVLNPSYTEMDEGYKEAKAFIKACKDAGVPPEILKDDKLKFKATRVIGYGSPVMQALVTADLLSVSAYYDERGKDNAVREYVRARAGAAGVRKFKPYIDRNQIPTMNHSVANLENNDLKEGSGALVGVDQSHVIHLLVHMGPLTATASAFVKGETQAPPEQILAYMEAAIRHCAEHLDYISQDPSRENEYQMFTAQLQEVAKVYNVVKSHVQRRQQEQEALAEQQQAVVAQAAEQVQDEKLQVELAKINADLQVRMAREQGTQAVREAKAMHQMQLDEVLARHKINLDQT